MTKRLLTGWGGDTSSAANVHTVFSRREVEVLLASRPHGGLIARGSGRSYGDAALNAGGTVVESRGLNGVGPFDESASRITVGAGATVGEVLRLLVPAGWTLPVVPGTQHVTVGGAVACDVHGKNHRTTGSFMSSVERFTLQTCAGSVDVDERTDPDLFWATAGGMGLTGVVSEVTLRVSPLSAPAFETLTWRTASLSETLRVLDHGSRQHALAWLDGCAPEGRLGRGIVTVGEPSPDRHARYAFRRPGPVPRLRADLMRRPVVRVVSAGLWHSTGKGPVQRTAGLEDFLFPFDRVPIWNQLFGQHGLTQWQGLVPRGSEGALSELLAAYRRHGTASPLVSLKRLGEANPGPLSFAADGWTLAIDFPARRPDLGRLLNRLDTITARAGGRVYLAKDSRLRPDMLRVMYPRLGEWQAVQRRADPAGHMRSDLARRLRLVGIDR